MGEKEEVAKWDAEVDVVVVGFGGAGACAALEAAEAGASVLIIDRYHGGGATAASGAVIYAGGGTTYQKTAGFDDTPEEMYKYMKQEITDAVSDETLRLYCEQSPQMISWLEKMGVPFSASLCPFKTSYPTDKYYIYYSGSENNGLYKANSKPAPRGHRARGKGISGLKLFHALEHTAQKKGVQIRRNTRVDSLVFSDDGLVIGIEGRTIPPGFMCKYYSFLNKVNSKLNTWWPKGGRKVYAWCKSIEKKNYRPYRARAKKGVILAAGGFMFNRKMVQEYNPLFRKTLPLGTYGDDGKGISLGQSAGGAISHMDRMSAWRFYTPPEPLIKGVLVDKEGKRICGEDLYGAKQGDYIAQHEGIAYLVFDSKVYKEATKKVWGQTAFWQKGTMLPMLFVTRKKAKTLKALAGKCRISPKGLEKTMAEYNERAKSGTPDPLGKMEKFVKPQETPPFYALDCCFGSRSGIPTVAMSLGGLVVDEKTSEVINAEGKPIQGLYAAGRNAVGLCSNTYFASGSSIGDCVFAGRRAGKHAASQPSK